MNAAKDQVIREGRILTKASKLDPSAQRFLCREWSDGTIEFYSTDSFRWLTAPEAWRKQIQRLQPV